MDGFRAARRGAIVAAFAFGLAALPALAQDGTDKDRRNGPRPSSEDPIRVFTPIKNMDDVFQHEGGGVFVPYRELLRLLDEARNTTSAAHGVEEAPPPEPFVFVGAGYKGSADEGVAQFEGTFDFEVLEKRKWVEIPLGLGNRIALEDVRTADGKRAIVRPSKDGGFAVLTQGAGRLTLKVKFAVSVNKQKPGQRSFDLQLPRAALSTFEVDLPERGLRVDVQPSLGQTLQDVEGGNKTRVNAFLGSGAAANVSVTWFPKPKEDAGPRKSLVFSELATSLWLDEGIAKAFAQARYSVEQAPQDTFRIAIPKDWKILQVGADGLREHEVTEGPQGQVLRVSFHERVKQALVTFRLERTREDGSPKFDFPSIRTLDAERETGVICAASSAFLKLEAGKISGLSQIDAGEIPAALVAEFRNDPNAAADRPPLGFRFLKNDWKLEVATTKVEPEVEGRVYSLATVRDDEIGYAAVIDYTIKKRGIFSVRIKLPAGFVLLDCGNENTVKSTSLRDATPADKWQGQILDVDFPRQVKPGNWRLTLFGTLARKNAARVDLPVIALDGVTKETGIVGVSAAKHLKVTTSGQPAGLVNVPVGELRAANYPYTSSETEELTFGFKYGKPGAAAAFDVAKREPKVTTTVETVVNADLDRITVDGDVHYKVEFAGIDKLELKVPERLNTEEAFKITADGNTIKERKLVPVEGKGDGTRVWQVELQSKREGNFRLHYWYEIKLDKLSAGDMRTVALDEVQVLGAEREVGDIALLKHENLVITDSDTTGLEARDAAKELPEGLARLGAFRGYHYVAHPWKLALQIIKYDFQAPLAKIVEHLHLDEVVQRDGTIQCEAWIRLRNNQGQFLRINLPKGAEVAPLVRVGDRQLSPSNVGDPKAPIGIDVMLPEETRRGDPVLVRFRYWFKKNPHAVEGMGSVELEAPTFPVDAGGSGADKPAAEKDGPEPRTASVPVARFTRNVYLPSSVCYLDFDTDMTTHFERGGLFEGLKNVVFGHLRETEGAGQAFQAAQEIHRAPNDGTGSYPTLEIPNQLGGPRLFEKLDGQARLRISYVGWPSLYGLSVAALLLVLLGGAFVEGKGAIRPVPGFAVAAGTTFLLAVIAPRSLEPFLTTAFAGSLGLGGYWLVRGLWRELTVESHRRKLEALEREAAVAKARAQAAEAEAKILGDKKGLVTIAAKQAPSHADHAAASRIGFEDSLRSSAPMPAASEMPPSASPAAPAPAAPPAPAAAPADAPKPGDATPPTS